MWAKATKCPKCGGGLSYEAIGSYGDIYKISQNTGIPTKKRERRVHYEHGDEMVYYLNCSENYDFKWHEDALVICIREEDDD